MFPIETGEYMILGEVRRGLTMSRNNLTVETKQVTITPGTTVTHAFR